MTNQDPPAWHDAVLGMDGLTGPTTFLCEPQALRNIEAHASMVESFGSVVVPHFKSHRLPPLADYQLAAGAAGFEVAMMSDAIQLYRHGLECAFTLAWCWDRPVTWHAAAALAAEGATLSVDVDSSEIVAGYGAAATAKDVTLGVRVQVDTGLRGIEPKEAVALARTVLSTPGLRLEGVTAYRSLYRRDETFDDRLSLEELGREEGEMLVALTAELADDVDSLEIVCGSTVTSRGAASVPGVTGVGGGSYATADLTQANLGHCTPDAVAIGTVVTVVEATGDTGTIDAGFRHLGLLSDYPEDLPGRVYAATHDQSIELTQTDALSGQVRRNSGPPLRAGQRLLLMTGNATSTARVAGAVVVVDDHGTVTGAWARASNKKHIDDVLI